MKKPRSPIEGKPFSGEDFDSDATSIRGSQDSKSAKKGLHDTSYIKRKKKPNTTAKNTWNHWNGNGDSQVFEAESESLLKVGKKKHNIKFTRENDGHDDGHFDAIQSQSFLIGDKNMTSDSLFTDDSEIISSDKRKKRKVKSGETNESPKKKKKKHHTDFHSPDIYKQESSENFFSSTPLASPKKVNKNNGISNLLFNIKEENGEASNNLNDSAKKINGLTDFINNGIKEDDRHHSEQEDNIKAEKKRKKKLKRNERESLSVSFEKSPEFNKRQKKKKSIKEDKLSQTDLDGEVNKPNQNNQILDISLNPSISLDNSGIQEESFHDKLQEYNTNINVKVEVDAPQKKHTTHTKSSPKKLLQFNGEQKKKNKKSRKDKSFITITESEDGAVKDHNYNSPLLEFYSLNHSISLADSKIKEEQHHHHFNLQENNIDTDIKTQKERKNKSENNKQKNMSNSFETSPESNGVRKKKKKKSRQETSSDLNGAVNGYNHNEQMLDVYYQNNFRIKEEETGLPEDNIDRSKNEKKTKKDSDKAENTFGVSGSPLEASTVIKIKKKSKHLSESNSLEQSAETDLEQDKALILSPEFKAKKKLKKKSIETSPVTSVECKEEIKSPTDLKRSSFTNKDESVSSPNKVTSEGENVSPKDKKADAKRKCTSLKDRFENIPFEVNFEVPALHKILDKTSYPTLKQKKEIELRALKLKLGKFTKIEDKQIKENWKQFIEAYGLEDKPEVFFTLDKRCMPPRVKRNFLFHLARNMPKRTLSSVFRRFKILTAQTKRGRFTEKEDSFIKDMLKSKDKHQIVEIAERLQRPAIAVATRIKLLENAHTRKIKWRRKHNAAAFIKYLLKVTKISEENIKDLEGRHISSAEWRKLSKKLDNVPVRILHRTWLEKLHPALFMPGDFYDFRQIKFKLIKMLCDNQEVEWAKVKWRRYADKFPGLTYLRIYSFMKQLVRCHVPKSKRTNLKKCLKVLSKVPEKDIVRRVIYKIKYENGTVRYMNPEGDD